MSSNVETTLNACSNNLTALQTVRAPPWVSSTSIRGTTDILTSCLFTMITCVYSALHLNVSSARGTWTKFKLTGQWILIALIAPETVVYLAASQLLEARWLKKELQTAVSPKSERTSQQRDAERADVQKPASQVHIRDLCPERLKWYNGYLTDAPIPQEATLTTKGVMRLYKAGYRIDISGEKIKDRSKQDTLQKCLVVCQVGWMALQCVIRRQYGLPLTLLEVHTMVHVVCAMSMYAFWLKKPQNINEPEVINSTSWDNLLALMVQASFFVQQNAGMVIVPAKSRTEDPPAMPPQQTQVPGEGTGQKRSRWVSPTESGAILRPGDILDCGIKYDDIGGFGDLHLTPVDVTRWKRLAMALREIYGDVHRSTALNELVFPDFQNTLTRGGNLQADFEGMMMCLLSLIETLEYLRRKLKLLALMCVLAAAYGGIHLSAWNNEFPSRTEEFMWRYACFAIIAILPFMLALWCIFQGVVRMIRPMQRSFTLIEIIRKVALFLWAINGASRVYITVEAFVSLRSVPIGVYWTPDWLEMLPHI